MPAVQPAVWRQGEQEGIDVQAGGRRSSVMDHGNPAVEEDCKGWLRWLRYDVGFDVSDIIQYAHRALLADWVKAAARGTPHMIDYTTKGILQAAVQNCEYWRLIDPQGRPPGLIGLLPGKAVTFVDNHSTGSTQQHLMPSSHPARSLPPVHASFPPAQHQAVTFVDNHSTGSTQQHLMPPHPARSLRPAHASFPPGPTPGSHVRGQSLHGLHTAAPHASPPRPFSPPRACFLSPRPNTRQSRSWTITPPRLHTAALAIPRLGGHSGVRGEGTWEGRGQGWDRYSEAEMREGRLGHEDNHSTGSSQQRWPFPSWEVTLGYVYILTHPGVPCVFIDHLYEWNLKDPIQKLLVIRQRNGITSRSAIRIMTCSTQLYVARIGTNVDDDRLFRGSL
ncbi:unnamed protein product [Closterium sp. NIES-64]|nr:unnamed protein product [Closterium sp. NIES-64]